MKRIIRGFIVETVVLYLVFQATKGLEFQDGIKSIFIAGVGLTLASLLVRPIINILLLPVNLITFGLFKWISNAVTLYLVDLVLEDFKVASFSFSGFSNAWFTIPAYSTISPFISYILFSFIIYLLAGIIYWLIK